MANKIEAALRYAAQGWPVFPVHSVRSGVCTCQDRDCKSAGKHPRTARGLHDATTDAEQIVEWWTRWPDANIGGVTGAPSGIVVLDVDPKHGGDKTLGQLQGEHGQLPDGPFTRTGSGGWHHFFRHPGTHFKSKTWIAPGLDSRGDGGYVVLPPSRNQGGTYQWVREIDGDLPPVPDWLLRLVSMTEERAAQASASNAGDCIPEGTRNSTLTSFAGTMRHRGASEEVIFVALQAMNRERCVPPLEDDEVRRIATSVARYAAGQRPTHEAYGSYEQQSAEAYAPVKTWPDPPAAAAYYGLAGEIIRTIEPHTESDPVALLVQFLVAFGNTIGRNRFFLAEADRHYMNLYAVLVGSSAKGRKGTALGQVMRLVGAVDKEWADRQRTSGLSSGEGLIWAVRDENVKREAVKEKGHPEHYREVTVDDGVRDKRLFVVESEFASILKVMRREGNTLSPVIRNAWDTGMLQTLTKTAPARATDAHISIVAHITQDELRRNLDTTDAANGFANRFLWLCVRRSKLLPEGGQLHASDLLPFSAHLRAAVEFSRTAGEMRRDDEARALWHRVYGELSEGKPGLLGSVVSRAEAQVMRLACIYALLDRSGTVCRQHLEAALALWRYAEASAQYIFGDALGDPVADELLRALRQAPEGLTRTEIRDLFHRHKGQHDISRALTSLLSLGLVYFKMEDTNGPGRPTERWFAAKLSAT